MWTAFALGIAFRAPPGPVNAEAGRRGLHRGFRGAFLTEVGALVGDTAWAILANYPARHPCRPADTCQCSWVWWAPSSSSPLAETL